MSSNHVKSLVLSFLAGLRPAPVQRRGRLWVHPFRLPLGCRRPAYLTLERALGLKQLEVRERLEPDPGELEVENRGEEMVFIMDGQGVWGGKQDRTAAISVLVPPRTTVVLPVNCLERERWSKQGASVSAGGIACLALRAGEGVTAESKRHSEGVREASESFSYWQGYAGIAMSWRRYLVGLDVFNPPGALAQLWPKLIPSYVSSALDASICLEAALKINELFERLSEIKFFPRAQPGAGEGYSLRGEGLIGSVLIFHSDIIHLALSAPFCFGLHPLSEYFRRTTLPYITV